ncbi:MAG: methylase [Pseudonocardiales bacterium]|nr:MAG: methylase [Pseudonocardiales bacterium]
MSEQRAARIRQWHEGAYRRMRAISGGDHPFGRTLVMMPQVQPITPVSYLLGKAVLAEVKDGDRVLDMGTGSGVNAILAASKAAKVLAVDINPHALAAARDNTLRNGVADRVEVRRSDVFSNVDGMFDLIVFDPPFRWFAPRDLLEAASTDENHDAMTRFFRQARRHLADGGRMLIFFGTTGDLAYLQQLSDEAGFQREVVAQRSLIQDGWQVDYFTFRLTA